jgi:hypothetical protein
VHRTPRQHRDRGRRNLLAHSARSARLLARIVPPGEGSRQDGPGQATTRNGQMRFIDTVLDAAHAVDLGPNEDERGFFARTLDANLFRCGFE